MAQRMMGRTEQEEKLLVVAGLFPASLALVVVLQEVAAPDFTA